MVATGVCGDGRREVLGFAVGDCEDGAFWTQFLQLEARGLTASSWSSPTPTRAAPGRAGMLGPQFPKLAATSQKAPWPCSPNGRDAGLLLACQ